VKYTINSYRTTKGW